MPPARRKKAAVKPKVQRKKKPPTRGSDSLTYPFFEGFCISPPLIRTPYYVGIDIGEVNFGICALSTETYRESNPAKTSDHNVIQAIGVVNLRSVHPYYSNPNAKKKPLTRYEIVKSVEYLCNKSKSMSVLFKHAAKIIVETQGTFEEGGPSNGWIECALLGVLGTDKCVSMSANQSKKAMPHIFNQPGKPGRGSNSYARNKYNKKCIDSVPTLLPFSDTENHFLEKIRKPRRNHALDAWLMATCMLMTLEHVDREIAAGSLVAL